MPRKARNWEAASPRLPVAHRGTRGARAPRQGRVGRLGSGSFSPFSCLGFGTPLWKPRPWLWAKRPGRSRRREEAQAVLRSPDSASPPVQELPRLLVAWKSGRKGKGGGGWPENGARATAAAFLLPTAPPRPSRREAKSRVASQALSQGRETRRQSPPWPLR